MRMLLGAALSVLLFGCSSGGGTNSDESHQHISAEFGGRVGSTDGAHIVIPPRAFHSDTSVSLGVGSNFTLPFGTRRAGPSIKGAPDGLTFLRAATLAVPVNPALLDNGVEWEDLVVYRKQSNGDIAQVPVTGYDARNMLLFAAIEGFSEFQAAVPTNTFAIVPRTSLLVTRTAGIELELATANANGQVYFTLVQSSKLDGITESDAELEDDELAPGVRLTETGSITGTPTELGTWTFVVSATDSTAEAPQSASISLTVTVVDEAVRKLPDVAAQADSLVYRIDDRNTVFALTRARGQFRLSRMPVDDTEGELSVLVPLGSSADFALSPDGEALVVVYEDLVGTSLDFSVTALQTAIVTNGDSSADGIGFDLDGDGDADVSVSFATSSDTFTGSDADLAALATALDLAFIDAGLALRAVANGTLHGLSIVDNGEGLIASALDPAPRLVSGGDVLMPILGSVNPGENGLNQRVFAIEYDRDLNLVGGPYRIDNDPAADDPDASRFAMQALRPSVAFAADKGAQAPERLLYCVAWELMRDLDEDGALRSDMYARWREFGADVVSTPMRLDTTSTSGGTSGDPCVIAGSAGGCLVAWTERGSDEGPTPGDVAAIQLDVPTELDELPLEISPPEPQFLNDADTTSGLHPTLALSPDNRIFAVWSERDDTPTSTTSPAGLRQSQTHRILFPRELSLRFAEVNAGTVGTVVTIDESPVFSSAYKGTLAASADGGVTIAWIEQFEGVGMHTLLRRFDASGVPLSNVIQIGAGTFPMLMTDANGGIALGFDGGETITVYTVTHASE